MWAAGAVFGSLLLLRAPGFWSYLSRHPDALDRTSAQLWLRHLFWPALAAGVLWTLSLGAGRRLWPTPRPAPDQGLETVAAAALGLGILGQALFALALFGLLRTPALAALTLGCAALVVPRLIRDVRASWTPSIPSPQGRLRGAAAGLLAYAAFQAVIRAAAPPTDWDARAYHLPLAELTLRAGALVQPAWMIHSRWPHLTEALYTLPLTAAGNGAAALVHAGAAGLLLAGVFLAGRRAAGPAAGWTAALLLAGQPVLLREAGQARADLACALFAFAAAVALARAHGKGSERLLLTAGLLAGFCGAAKLTGLATIAGGVLFLVMRDRRARPALVFLGGALLVVGPWLARTWLQTGDPVWPFAGADASAAALAARYLRSNRWDFPPPFWLLEHDGPLFLLLPTTGLILLAAGRPSGASVVEKILWCGAPFYALLGWRHHEAWRFLAPAWPAAALAAGRAAAAAMGAPRARGAAAVLLVAVGAMPIALASANNELFAVCAPRPLSAPDADRRALFEERSVDVAGFYRRARAVLPPGAKVLLFREIRGYGAGFDYLWGDPVNQALIDYRALPDSEALAARLKALGVTHVLDHPGSTLYREDPGYYDRRTLTLMADCLRRRARPVLDDGGIALYELL